MFVIGRDVSPGALLSFATRLREAAKADTIHDWDSVTMSEAADLLEAIVLRDKAVQHDGREVDPQAWAYLEACAESFCHGYRAPAGHCQQMEMTWIAAGCPLYAQAAATPAPNIAAVSQALYALCSPTDPMVIHGALTNDETFALIEWVESVERRLAALGGDMIDYLKERAAAEAWMNDCRLELTLRPDLGADRETIDRSLAELRLSIGREYSLTADLQEERAKRMAAEQVAAEAIAQRDHARELIAGPEWAGGDLGFNDIEADPS